MPATTLPEAAISDPLLYLAPLPHTRRVYAYGFPVDIAGNAHEVVDAAVESWGAYPARFDRPPVRIHVTAGEGRGPLPPSPVLRGQRHLLLWISDQENFAVIDRRQRFGFSCVSRTTLEDRTFFRWHFLDALTYMLLELNYTTSIHAACVAWQGAGVLLYGPSGVGKSTLSYACARRGWTYISDDSSSVLWGDGREVIGEPHHFRFRAEAPDLFPELRGRTVGYQLDHKPTIEVLTADLPIQTAPQCRVERLVFLNRVPSGAAHIQRITVEEAFRRIRQDMPTFDPDLEGARQAAVETVTAVPAIELTYSGFESAVTMLEQLLQPGVEA
jgi:HPr Serine kinase C-terminal domain